MEAIAHKVTARPGPRRFWASLTAPQKRTLVMMAAVVGGLHIIGWAMLVLLLTGTRTATDELQRRGSTWIFGPAPAPSGRHPPSTAPTSSSPTVAATSGRGSTSPWA